MRVKIPLAIVIVLAAAVGYLMGTDSGRQQRDVILVKLRRGEDDAGDHLSEAVTASSDEVSEAMADANADA